MVDSPELIKAKADLTVITKEYIRLSTQLWENLLRSLAVKEGTCSNCHHAFPSNLEWIFCREPERMKGHTADYRANKVPQGGYPHSRNYTCPKWEMKV